MIGWRTLLLAAVITVLAILLLAVSCSSFSLPWTLNSIATLHLNEGVKLNNRVMAIYHFNEDDRRFYLTIEGVEYPLTAAPGRQVGAYPIIAWVNSNEDCLITVLDGQYWPSEKEIKSKQGGGP